MVTVTILASSLSEGVDALIERLHLATEDGAEFADWDEVEATASALVDIARSFTEGE